MARADITAAAASGASANSGSGTMFAGATKSTAESTSSHVTAMTAPSRAAVRSSLTLLGSSRSMSSPDRACRIIRAVFGPLEVGLDDHIGGGALRVQLAHVGTTTACATVWSRVSKAPPAKKARSLITDDDMRPSRDGGHHNDTRAP